VRPILRPTIFSEQDAIVLGGGDTNLDCFSTRLMSRCTVEGVRVKKEFYTIQVLKRHCEQSRKDTGRSRYEALSTMPCIIRPKKTPRCRHGVRRRHNRPHDSRDDSKSKTRVASSANDEPGSRNRHGERRQETQQRYLREGT